jgi:hypothetical protein
MKFLKKFLPKIPKLSLGKKATRKLPTVFLNRNTQNVKPLSKQRNIERIAKRSFQKNAPINWIGKLTQVSRWIWLSVFLAIFIGTAYVTFFTELFYIKKIQIFEGDLESTNLQIRKITEPLRNRNIFLFNKEDLSSTIQDRVANLTELTVTRQVPDTVIIKYKKFQDVANINNLIGQFKVRKSFVMNEAGILTEQDKISTTLPSIVIETEKAFTLGEQIIKSEEIKYILDTKKYFEDKFNLKATEIKYLPNPKELRILTERNFTIWIDMLAPYQDQLNKLKNAVPKINVYEGQLEYVDLRIQSAEGQKIIYR